MLVELMDCAPSRVHERCHVSGAPGQRGRTLAQAADARLVHGGLVRQRRAVRGVRGRVRAPRHELDDYPRVFDRDYGPMRPETRTALRARFAEPNRRLEALLGRDLGW